MLALIKKNMVVIGVIVIAAGVLYLYMSSSGGGATLTSDTQSPVSNEILVTLGNLRTIQLDNSLFKEPLFMSLSDFGVAIPPAAAGRRNPFAPVGQGGGATTVSTSTSGTTTQSR